MADQKTLTRKPKDEPFRQQKMKSWHLLLTPIRAIIIFFVVGIAFVPTGTYLISQSDAVYQSSVIYDGDGSHVNCSIDEPNEGKQCQVAIAFDKDVTGPVNVYYEVKNFYQNHRRYVNSRNAEQLTGAALSKSVLSVSCDPLTTFNNLILNPCGLIANSFFNDEIALMNANLKMDESDLSWAADEEEKFKQPEGFDYKQVTSFGTCSSAGLPDGCKNYVDPSTGLNYQFYYPDDDTTQYLYESYPQISPIDGVTDQHFMVWMRTAAFPNFRKIYGKINHDFRKGDVLRFNITANFYVTGFDGAKGLVVSTTSAYGGQNAGLGISYVVVGAVCLFLGVMFTLKHWLAPRELGDRRVLKWQ